MATGRNDFERGLDYFREGRSIVLHDSGCQLLGRARVGNAFTPCLCEFPEHLVGHCLMRNAGIDGPSLVRSSRVVLTFFKTLKDSREPLPIRMQNAALVYYNLLQLLCSCREE